MNDWTMLMVAASGTFAVGTVAAAARIPVWRRMTRAMFVPDFARTIALADKIQPALLLIALFGTVGYATGVEAPARTAAVAATVGFVGILATSGVVLVPLQRRIIRFDGPGDAIESMRERWFRGHLGRSVISVLSFALAIFAAIL
jgi:anthrone oxygenase-like protein